MDGEARNNLKVLLVEHQTLVRIGIRTILSERKNIEIVGEAATGASGLELFRQLKPDVTILSLRMPDSCAIDLLEEYFFADRQARILVLADTAGDAEISKALKKGALGYICKNIEPDELIKAIGVVAAGGKYIPSEIAGILSENLGSEELTPTESRVLRQIAAGKANKEIAYKFDVSENTVKTHVKNIFEKLGVSDRTSAATLAIRRGLIRFDV